MQSKATTVAAYLESLPADRRAIVSEVRKFLLANLDEGYVENMSYGMIGYCVPHELYPPGYHCNPQQALPFAALASQKNYLSLYLMGIYPSIGDADSDWFREAWAASGKKLDIGKCCIRFKKVDDLALDVLKKALKRWSVERYVANYEAMLGRGSSRKVAKKAAKKAAAKKTPKKAAKKAPPSSAAKTRAKKTAKK